MPWRCPTPECNGATLRAANTLEHEIERYGVIYHVKRRVLHCRFCRRNVHEVVESTITDWNRRSSYLPRIGQKRQRADRKGG
jgi:hypothetical protein